MKVYILLKQFAEDYDIIQVSKDEHKLGTLKEKLEEDESWTNYWIEEHEVIE